MKKRAILAVILMIFIFILGGCGKKSDTSSSYAGSAKQSSKVSSTDGGAGKDIAINSAGSSAKDQMQSQAKIIRNCELFIQTKDIKKMSEDVNAKSQEFSGYIEAENLGEMDNTMKVRIPSDKFDSFIAYLEKNYEVKNKNISSTNITDAYIDNDARLKNLRNEENQVSEILKRANTVDEVLKVQSELYRIRGEAEALEAKKTNWDREVGFSTITIRASQNEIVVESKNKIIGGSEFLNSIKKGFTNSVIFIVLALENILIFILSNIIQIGIIAVLGFIGFRFYRKHNKKV